MASLDSLRENRDLREFIIEDVQQTEDDRVLGTGSYGTVEEVSINHYTTAVSLL